MQPLDYRPPTGPVTVIYRDEALLVVDKPSGLLSVPGKPAALADCLETRLRADDPHVRLVHRLDLETSGVMVFARTAAAQRRLNDDFAARRVEKTYVALVDGAVTDQAGRIDQPVAADWPNRPRQKVCAKTGKSALTHWQVIGRDAGSTRMRLIPRTGRSHQLRVHMLHLGHPILGDPFYGDVEAGAPRLCLHAASLGLRHPGTGTWHAFSSAVPF